MHLTFDRNNFTSLCNILAEKDRDLYSIIQTFGYPPVWTRPASFETLIHIILEQQVSLASAKAALSKLKQRLGRITSVKLLTLSDEELKSCYFSAQKMGYARCLAQAIVSRQIQLKRLSRYDDREVKRQLKAIKGIGDWTADVYLLFALRRTDVFPVGDLAMSNALKEVKGLSKNSAREVMLKVSEPWRPYRSIATMLLWHHYIQKRGIRV